MSSIAIKKPGTISGYILGDLRPETNAEVLIDGKVIAIRTALLDTGANVTVLSPLLYQPEEGPEDAELLSAHKSTDAYVKEGSLILGSNDIVLERVSFLVADLVIFEAHEIQLIIGMDVITAGRFVIERKGQLPYYTFSFSGSDKPFIPSVGFVCKASPGSNSDRKKNVQSSMSNRIGTFGTLMLRYPDLTSYNGGNYGDC